MKIRQEELRKAGQRIASPPEGAVNFNLRKPKLSFEFLRGEFCLSRCELREKAEVADTLYRLSRHTWQELLTLGRKHGGCERLPVEALKCPVPQDILFREQRHATVFHNPGRIPVVGFRIDDVLYIFCIDRSYTAYDH